MTRKQMQKQELIETLRGLTMIGISFATLPIYFVNVNSSNAKINGCVFW